MVGLSKRKSTQTKEVNKPIPNQTSSNSTPQSGGNSLNGCFLITLSIGILLVLILLLFKPDEEVVAVPNASEVKMDIRPDQKSVITVQAVAEKEELLTEAEEVAGATENKEEHPKEEEVTKEIVDEEILDNWCPTCMWNDSEWMCKRRMHYLINFYHMEANEAKLSLLKQGLCSQKDSGKKNDRRTETEEDRATENMVEQPKEDKVTNEIVDEEVLDDWCPTCMWNTDWICKRRVHYLINFYHIEANEAKLSLLKQGLCSQKDRDKKIGRRLLRKSYQ